MPKNTLKLFGLAHYFIKDLLAIVKCLSCHLLLKKRSYYCNKYGMLHQ